MRAEVLATRAATTSATTSKLCRRAVLALSWAGPSTARLTVLWSTPQMAAAPRKLPRSL